MENYIFKKIFINGNTPVRILVTIFERSIEVILLQNENAWKSLALREELRDFTEQHKLSWEHYCKTLLKHIKSNDGDVIFALTESEFTINRLLDTALQVKFFSCKLNQVNYVAYVEQIMDQLHSKNTELVEKHQTLEKDKMDSDRFSMEVELKLQEVLEKKKTQEQQQVKEFRRVLKEKKLCIQQLSEQIASLTKGREIATQEVDIPTRSVFKDPLPVRQRETVSDSESTDSSSEEEDLIPVVTPRSPEPSTSTAAKAILEDDPLQACTLPKRKKHEEPTSDVVKASSSKSSKAESKKPEESTKESESVAIDLSTQQLLDML
ncbi:unnamed protein product [Tenebrio molitor]|jgi:hypothetical protein|nr:unnamed protein product [Tenebrio molitor]